MRHHLLAAMVLALACSPIGAAAQVRDPPRWPVCAELDLAAIWDIEEAGKVQQISGERLAAAFLLVMKARNACAEGRLSEAVAIYDEATFD